MFSQSHEPGTVYCWLLRALRPTDARAARRIPSTSGSLLTPSTIQSSRCVLLPSARGALSYTAAAASLRRVFDKWMMVAQLPNASKTNSERERERERVRSPRTIAHPLEGDGWNRRDVSRSRGRESRKSTTKESNREKNMKKKKDDGESCH